MPESLLNWIADTLTRTDVIDLYFVITDLVDMHISEEERIEMDCMNARASNDINATAQSISETTGIPLGKLVL